MNEVRRFSLVKPTIDTPFHIDFAWWKEHDTNWRVYLQSYLCPEHQQIYSDIQTQNDIDFVDPDTAEIQLVDGLQNILITHCAKQQGFLPEHTSLVDTVFRTLLANGNTPVSPRELATHFGRPAEIILRTLAGPQVYKGLRPCQV